MSDDFGAEPDPSAQPMYISDDIWVRNTNDGLANQDHQNPEYRIPSGPPNYVYVRVRNRGCTGSQSGTVCLYWAKASSSLAWPAPWDGSVTSPVLMGGSIGSQAVTVAAGDDEILVFPWNPPNPADYAAFGADQGHFCLLARIETSTTAPFGMTSPETGNLYANVQNNNNIVWKNITVVDAEPGTGRVSGIIVGNFSKEFEWTTLVFTISEKSRVTVFDWGQVFVELPPDLVKSGRCEAENAGVRQVDDNTFQILGPGAKLGPFELPPGALHGVRVRFVERHKSPFGVHVLTLDMTQKTGDRTVGGQRFVIKTAPDCRNIVRGNAIPNRSLHCLGSRLGCGRTRRRSLRLRREVATNPSDTKGDVGAQMGDSSLRGYPENAIRPRSDSSCFAPTSRWNRPNGRRHVSSPAVPRGPLRDHLLGLARVVVVQSRAPGRSARAGPCSGRGSRSTTTRRRGRRPA